MLKLRMVTVLLLTAAPLAAEPPMVVCVPSSPVAESGAEVSLRVSSDMPGGEGAVYDWTASSGTITGRDKARWSLKNAETGPQTAILEIKSHGKTGARCSVEVRVTRPPIVRQGALPTPGPPPATRPPETTRGTETDRTTARAILAQGQTEAPGFGLYSYLIFGAAPQDSAKDQYRGILEACLRLMPATAELEKYLPPGRLNSMFIPVAAGAPSSPDANWLLDHYDYARARALLTKVPGVKITGLYIVSASAPLLSPDAKGPYLVQDLSAIPHSLASTWVAAFINQAAQERFWEPATAAQLVLKLRLSLAVLAEGVPQVKVAVIQWVGMKG